jgi:hypothetical protein
MKISMKKAAATGLALTLGLGLAGFGATSATAAVGDWTPDGTPEPYYMYSLDTGLVVPAGTQLHYSSALVASPSETDPETRFADAPADAESTFVFIAPKGQETSINSWISKIDVGFEPGHKRVFQTMSSFSSFPATTFAPIKSSGGDYSLGIAYTKNNGVTFVGLGAYTYVHVTAGTADWTFDYPTPIGGEEPPAQGGSGQVAIEAPVAAPVDGALSLTVPTGAKATLGAATLDNEGRSVSTGTLPTFRVSDQRFNSKPGWTVNTSVAQFASGANVFDPAALSITPAIEGTTTAAGVTKVTSLPGATTAGKFAEAAAGQGTGLTDLSAALKLTAPLGTPAGTYTSTMTVTLVSK